MLCTTLGFPPLAGEMSARTKGAHKNQMTIFQKDTLDALFAELETSYGQTTDYDQLLRDAHLAIALSDAGKEYNGQVDQRVSTLIKKHRDGN